MATLLVSKASICSSIKTRPPRTPANLRYSSLMLARFQPCKRRRHPTTVPERWRPMPQQTSTGCMLLSRTTSSAATIERSVSWSQGLLPSVTTPRCRTSMSLSSAKAIRASLGSSTASQRMVRRCNCDKKGKLMGAGWPDRKKLRSTGAKLMGGTTTWCNNAAGRFRRIFFCAEVMAVVVGVGLCVAVGAGVGVTGVVSMV